MHVEEVVEFKRKAKLFASKLYGMLIFTFCHRSAKNYAARLRNKLYKSKLFSMPRSVKKYYFRSGGWCF